MASNIIEQENLAEIGDFSLYLISNDKDNIGLGILSSTIWLFSRHRRSKEQYLKFRQNSHFSIF